MSPQFVTRLSIYPFTYGCHGQIHNTLMVKVGMQFSRGNPRVATLNTLQRTESSIMKCPPFTIELVKYMSALLLSNQFTSLSLRMFKNDQFTFLRESFFHSYILILVQNSPSWLYMHGDTNPESALYSKVPQVSYLK